MCESLNPRPMEPGVARLKNPLALAYIGDTVWDLLVRRSLLESQANVNTLHKNAVARVNAGSQAKIAAVLEPLLTPEELEVFRRGCNAHVKHPTPKNQNPVHYSLATGLEALLGYLYLTGRCGRILELYASAEGEW